MNQFEEGMEKSLVCVEYPGRVVNVDKMINTLGGIRSISTVRVMIHHWLYLVTHIPAL